MIKSLGMVETHGRGSSLRVADVMLKTANVRLLGQEQVSMAYYTVFVEGDLAAVEMAVQAGKLLAESSGSLLSCKVIPRPNPETKKLYERRVQI